MRIIPVLDLKGGKVVRAAGGRRHDYRPIVTPLSPSPDVADVARGMRALYPFGTFYVADLDAMGVLVWVEEKKIMVPYDEKRKQIVIEAYLTDQWFVKADILAERAKREAAGSG